MTCLKIYAHGLAARGLRSVTILGVALLCICALATPVRAAISASGDILPNKEDLPDFPGVFILDYNTTTGAANGDVVVGGTGQSVNGTDLGTLFIDAPAFTPDFTSPTGIIGDEQQGSGFVTVSQAGSRWGISNELIVGDEGQGSLDLVNGGAVTGEPNVLTPITLAVTIGRETTGQGSVTVRSSGSLLRSNTLNVGGVGTGLLALTLGGQVETATNAIIGQSSSSGDLGTGLVTVDGSATRWLVGRFTTPNLTGSTGNLVVGGAGRGILNITNRGVVRVTNATNTAGNVIIGQATGALGEVTVDGLFSQLRTFGTITISQTNNARGVLRVQNGGEVRATGAINIGADGVLEVSGGNVLTPAQISNLGTIQTAPGSQGQIDSAIINGSTGEIRNAGTLDRVREKLIFTRLVTNQSGGLITSIGGEMEFTAGVTNSAGGLIAGRDAIFRFRDPFTNAGSLDFSVGVSDVYGTITNNGVVGVAHSTDVTFYDPFTNNATLSVQPGGTAIFLAPFALNAPSTVNLLLNSVADVDEIGQIQVFGPATLAGGLNVSALGGLSPVAGDSFQILTATSISGTFDPSRVILPPAPGNNWMLQYTPTSVLLNYVTAAPFDADVLNDGIVNGDDLAIILANFGLSPATQSQGDVNGDGRVDGDDFLIWQQHLGQPSAAPAASPVPEPGSVAIMLSALALAAGARRKRTALAARRPAA